jgi:hypothetical protein
MKTPKMTEGQVEALVAEVKKLRYCDWSYDGDENWNHNQALTMVRFILGLTKEKKQGLVQPQ